MRYEVLVWTKFGDAIPYTPVEAIHGKIDTLEKAEKFAEMLMKTLKGFKPTRYEIIECKNVLTKEVEVTYNNTNPSYH